MFDNAWPQSRINPPYNDQFSSRAGHVTRFRLPPVMFCAILTRHTAAFNVESQHLHREDDPRRIVGHATNSSTFVVTGKYYLAINLTFYAQQSSQPSVFETIMKTINDGILDGLNRSSVFAVPSDMQSEVVKTGPGAAQYARKTQPNMTTGYNRLRLP